MWEVCAEVGKTFPVRKVNKPGCGVRHFVVLSGDESYGGVDVLPPIHQGRISQDWSDGGGCADTSSVGPSLCHHVINVCVDMRQGRHSRGEYQELHEERPYI